MQRCACAGTLVLVCLFAIRSGFIAEAGEIGFRKHVIDADAQFCAAAVIDVNHDGKLDVVCGSNWYEAPTWKKHFVREVEALGNPPRFDGYAHLPMDVNGDGWMDIITVNYRSKSLKWLEHPGPSFGPWTAHTIDEPGPMETGRLVDIDGDGQLDIFPNGVQVAGWWELVREKNADGSAAPRFIRHDLPREIAGHGVGFGDVDGDGRGDIVGPRGWLQAPADPRNGRWLWHPEFDLDTASVPILVVDVNGDGHNDIVWGRAHNFGLYWLEQDASDPKQRRWIKHTIDTSWGGAHAPLWADLDGDGVPELIAGKRYLPHEGRDPGEYDPLVAYRYQFDRAIKTWRRWPISVGDGVGFGLDPKVIDFDGDGDLDLVCADRCGLYWLENLRVSHDEKPAASVEIAAPKYNDHKNVLVVKDAVGAERPVKTPFEWGLRRAHILSAMEEVLGRLPDPSRRVPLELETVKEFDSPGFTTRSVYITTEPGDRILVDVCVPKDVKGKVPAVVCNNIRSVAPETLAQRGYITVSVKYPHSDNAARKILKKDQGPYTTLEMKAIWDNIRALDLLETLPEVDIDRIGFVGDSSDGRAGVFTAVFDQRIAATVCICGLTTFAGYKFPAWGSLANEFQLPIEENQYRQRLKSMPFDFHEAAAALAPRSLLVVARADDHQDLAGTKEIVESAWAAYQLRGVESKLATMYFDDESRLRAAQDQVCQWLDKQLKR